MNKVVGVFVRLLTLVVFPAILLWVGYAHVGPLFQGEFTQHTGSIEVSYISMARFIKESLPQFAWQPRWYLGYPLSIVYTPLVPFFEVVANGIFGWSFGHAYRVLTAAAYVGVLACLYFFARTLYKNSAAGLVSALSYGILPSIIAFLYDEVAQDVFSTQTIDPRRFTILVRWGEGPHIVSLLFLPIAAYFLIKFLRQGSKWTLAAGAFFTSLVLLTNTIGSWGLAILAFCLVVGQLVENSSRSLSKSTIPPFGWQTTIGRAGVFAVISYGISAFWFNPLFVSTFFQEGSGALNYWRDQFPWGWLMLTALLVIYILVSKKLLARFRGATASVLFFLIMFGLVNTYYASGSEKLELVPQVLRLNTEVDMASSLLLGMVVAIVGYLLFKKKTIFYLSGMTVIVVVAGIYFWSQQVKLVEELPQYTKSIEAKGIDLTKTAEYEVAKNLEQRVTGDERVFVPGNYAFYLNYFTDLPQLRGALFQSSIHPWPEHIYYQVTNGKDGDISLDWLKIANIGWLVYSGPREVFRDYRVPTDKFDTTLELVDEQFGDRYYKVPLKNSSLAKRVPKDILTVAEPINAIDEEPIRSYVNFLEASDNQLTIAEKVNGAYEVSGEIGDGELVLVQMAYAPGWRARDGQGQTLEVKRDTLGFIIVKPKEAGKQKITLTYSKPWQVWVGWVLSLLTVGTIVFMLIKVKKPLLVSQSRPKIADIDIDS